MSSHAIVRRPALPALLLTVAAAALLGLSLLPPARTAAAPTGRPVLVADTPASLSLASESQRAAVLARPALTRTLARHVAPHPAERPAPRPIRAARSKPVDAVPAGYVCPVRGPRSFVDSWGFARPGGRHHEGTDVMAPYGEPVVAVISGVIHPNYSRNGGISLYLEGVDGNEYFYAHNSRNVAVDGQRVSTGEVIGYVGNTGDARGGASHVHFERHPGGGRPVDPYPFVLAACGS